METLTKHFREITQAAFARHGFAQADLVINWAEIVGEDLARISRPERIKWPRSTGDAKDKAAGTLVVKAAPGRSLDLQYEASRMVARINSFFGYQAIAQIKVMQASTGFAPPPSAAPPEEDDIILNQPVDMVNDDSLKAALERLGKAVAKARQSSPQAK